MKLTTNTNVSVDGVMQGLGGPDEDRRGGFVRGGFTQRAMGSPRSAEVLADFWKAAYAAIDN